VTTTRPTGPPSNGDDDGTIKLRAVADAAPTLGLPKIGLRDAP
jgi:hypothetical protein